MPPDHHLPGKPEDWLARAKSALILSRASLPKEALYEDLCFYAQQAAEKAIKAVYRYYKQEFRYTHNIAALLDTLRRKGVSVPDELNEAAELTEFALATRYPGTEEPVAEIEYREAVAQAEKVVRWAEAVITSKPGQ